ncbi:MAG: hypothetical protein ACWA5Q_11370 [bacterium]
MKKYLQLLFITLGLGLAVQTTVLAEDAPKGDKSGEEQKGDPEPECD